MLTRLLRPVYHAAYRAALPLRYALCDFRARSRDGVIPPAALRFRVCEDLSITRFLNVGERCAQIVDEAIAARGRGINEPRRVLDFGCGCGRTMRWFLARDEQSDCYGVDVDRPAIAWCASHLQPGTFSVNDPDPPLAFADCFFDVVYCFSVFTHLDQRMQDAWLAELGRVLRPGGLLLLSVHGAAAAAGLGPAMEAEVARDGFVHKRSRKLRGILPEWYHTTLHSPDYIAKRLFGAGFEDVRYQVIADGIQDVVTAIAGPRP